MQKPARLASPRTKWPRSQKALRIDVHLNADLPALLRPGLEHGANEALEIGLANRLVEDGQALDEALALARLLCSFPQGCLRSDRLSACEQWGQPLEQALGNEFQRGMDVIASRETVEGASRFAAGHGRHGKFDDI